MTRNNAFILLLAATSLSLPASAQKTAYKTIKTFHISSPGGWDYVAVSPVKDYLYVSHSSQVNILNKTTGDSIGILPNTDGVHGIAFVPGLKKGYTSNGKSNSLTVFNANNNTVTGQVKTGSNPDAIMYDPFSDKIYVCNGHSHDITIVNPTNDQVVKTLDVGGKPETAVSDEAGNIYVNIEDKSEIVVIDTKTLSIQHRWKTGKGEAPSGLAIDTKTKRLFAGCDNKLLVVMNATNGKVISELPIGDGCDGVAFDAGLKTIFSSNGEGTLTVIKEQSADKYEVLEQAPTKRGARTIAVDLQTHFVYLPTAEFAATSAANAGHHPATIPGTFQVLVISNQK